MNFTMGEDDYLRQRAQLLSKMGRANILEAHIPGRNALPDLSGLHMVVYPDIQTKEPTLGYQACILTEDSGEAEFIKDLGTVKRLHVTPEQLAAIQESLEGDTPIGFNIETGIDLYLLRSDYTFTLSNGHPYRPSRESFDRTGSADYVYAPESGETQIAALITGVFKDPIEAQYTMLSMLNAGVSQEPY